MTLPIVELESDERASSVDEPGLGALQTERGNLPLTAIDASVNITGLVSHIQLTQDFHNPHDTALEATYIFPLPDRAAVTAMSLTAADRTINARLQERGAARQQYDEAIAAGQRAAIAEEERPDVFTMRVGNIAPGESVRVALTLVGPLSYEDGEATFRLPLVVAPRYIPGTPSTGDSSGAGWAFDTDAVPDASRITPPVLLPGFPNPVRLSIGVVIDPAGMPLQAIRSSLHAVQTTGNTVRIEPGERVNRDFILRLGYGDPDASTQALFFTADGSDDGDWGEGTFQLTILPPTSAAPPRPRDVVVVLDRSGSMTGWKMVAARRAAARIVDTLTAHDRMAVIAFDDQIDCPTRLGTGLQPATDRNRYAAVEFLSRMESRGGTELLAPLRQALGLLTDATRDRVIVLVTDGQVGNEDQLLDQTSGALQGVRVHTVGIDQAVNAGFLGRLAAVGGGRCELVESEDRLDEAMDHIHRRIGAPVATGLTLDVEGFELLPATMSPARLPDLFPGAPLVITGRYRKAGSSAAATVQGRTRAGEAWSVRLPASATGNRALTAVWARAHLRDLEDAYAGRLYGAGDDAAARAIVAASLRFGVLCRFTAWVAIDERVVTDGGTPHKVVQPVELPAGWQPPDVAAMPAAPRAMRAFGGTAMTHAASMQPMAAAPSVPDASALLYSRAASASMPAPKAAVSKGPDTSAQMRTVAAEEARRLRASASAPAFEKRELLADLGTRLTALARDLPEGQQAQAVRELITDLGEDRLARLSGAELDALWERALAVLDGLSEGGSSSTRKPFWKRSG